MSDELKNELIQAMFLLRNHQFQNMGGRRFLAGGAGGQDVTEDGVELNMPAFTLLKQLQKREKNGETGGALLTDMGDYLRVSKAAVSQMLSSLESRGLVTRETDPENRRTIIVKLTEKGNEIIERVERRFDIYIEMLIDRLGEKDTREIIRLLYRLDDILADIAGDGLCASKIGAGQ